MKALAARVVSVLVLGGFSCSGQIVAPEPEAPATLATPTRAGFKGVADALQPTCGTLDCHGQVGRNLRLYGERGLRLAPLDTSGEGATTDAEYEATYLSVTGLEPEIMSLVIEDKGARPDRLSLIRKARGDERHKGGSLMHAGDDLDRCLLSWLAGVVAAGNCQAVADAERPSATP